MRSSSAFIPPQQAHLAVLSDAVQPSGCLMAIDRSSGRISHVSANLEAFLGLSPDEVLGVVPGAVTGLNDLRVLIEGIEQQPDGLVVKEFSREVDGVAKNFQLTAWVADSRLVLEIEPVPRLRQRRIMARINYWLSCLAGAETRESLLDILVKGVAELTGFERVITYPFDKDWSGQVIAEYVDGMDSLLGYCFPATDLPPAARGMYDVNPVRCISDASAEPVPLLTMDRQSLGIPELSRSVLRAAPPVYLQRLRDMGVGGSFTLAIHSGEALWGLVICHSRTALLLSPALRDAALMLVLMATQRLFLLAARDNRRSYHRIVENSKKLTLRAAELRHPTDLVHEFAGHWLGAFNACGVAFSYGRAMNCAGVTPADDSLQQMIRLLTARHHQPGPWSTDEIRESALGSVIELNGCTGLLALPLTAVSPPGWLLLFRPEQTTVKRWVGHLEQTDGSAVVDRKGSIAIWEETIQGRSAPWLPPEIDRAGWLAESLSTVVSAHHISQLNEQLKQSNQNLASLARTDSLTGVWNRYHMEEELAKEVARAERYQRPCSVLLFDVDHFKAFNDNHGHEAGDRILKSLMTRVQTHLRATDRLGRWGGEEFILLAANCTGQEGVELAERLRREVESLELDGIGQITVSMGIAEWRAGESYRMLVKRADEAMYQAKEGGRNRVQLAH